MDEDVLTIHFLKSPHITPHKSEVNAPDDRLQREGDGGVSIYRA